MIGTIYRYLCSLSAPMRIGLILGTLVIGIPLLREMLTSPLWGILLGLLAGVNAYLLADRKFPGYRVWIVLILVAPEMSNPSLRLNEISTGAMVVAFLTLAIVFEPGEFSRFLKWSRKSSPKAATAT